VYTRIKESEHTRDLNLQRIGGCIKVYYRGKKIIEHQQKRPFLTVGEGEGRFRSWNGNYRVGDRLSWSRDCSRMEVSEEGPERIVLLCPETIEVTFQCKENRLFLSFRSLGPTLNRLWLRLAAEPEEHIYGGGEQYSRLDLRGSRVPLWVQEQGVGRGRGLISLLAEVHSHAGGSWYSTYFPQTAFVSSRGWYCRAEASAFAEFDFSGRHSYRLHFWELPALELGVKESFPAAAAALNHRLGLQPRLPEWVYGGMWLGVQGGREAVERKLADAQEAGVEVGALWAQDWEGKRETKFGRQLRWDWIYDPEFYPDLPGYIAELHERGIRFMGYINPFLIPEGELYKEASPRGYLVQKPGGGDYLIEVTTFPAALVDLTNPEACEWIKGVIKERMIGIGMDGWMADFGEYLPTDAVLYSGESAETFHNRYPAEWARVNREAVEEAGRLGDIVFFMRAGYNGATGYATAYWGGDQLVNWSLGDGLATAITAGLSIGHSGVGFYHTDIGGYTSLAWVKRSRELLMRWAEHAPFTQIMRTHEGNRPDSCWQFNSDRRTLEHLARMTDIYTRLAPYHRHCAEQYVSTGRPPIAHPALQYAGDETLHSLQYQYLYGEDLMVAPVYKRGVKRWKVYLPEDAWVHLWSGREFDPGWQTVPAPLGSPPVFYRKGSPFAELFGSFARKQEQ
jgi:alpha-glucosidase